MKSPLPTPKLEDNPLPVYAAAYSVIRRCPQYLEAFSSNRDLRRRQVAATSDIVIYSIRTSTHFLQIPFNFVK
jgi:hypothetical protein